MQGKQVFEYAIVRVVPRVERGECINVGVMVFCKRTRFLEMKYQLDEPRLRAFSAQLDLEELAGYLHGWDLICQGRKEGGPIARLDVPERFRWLSAVKSTILQCSRVHPGLCEDPKALLERLFDQYVA
ncbi:MAG: DUF3037 domain-containing protein [Bacteroidia bacterium]|nr:DUF3037 domain-containing protein [Bacteroidia bacterium]